MMNYEKLAIPESKTAARGGLTSAAAVDFNKQHVPLLITSGSEDNLIPPHLINRNYKKYKKNDSGSSGKRILFKVSIRCRSKKRSVKEHHWDKCEYGCYHIHNNKHHKCRSPIFPEGGFLTSVRIGKLRS